MVRPTDVPVQVHWESHDLVVMTRVLGSDGTGVLQADLTGITLHVFERLTGERIGVATTVAIGDSVFDVLQTEEPWEADTIGYNFRYTIDGSFFPDGGVTYRVEIVANPVTGSDFLMAAIDVEVQNRFSD